MLKVGDVFTMQKREKKVYRVESIIYEKYVPESTDSVLAVLISQRSGNKFEKLPKPLGKLTLVTFLHD